MASGEYGEAVHKLTDGVKSLIEKPIQMRTTKEKKLFRWGTKAYDIQIDVSNEDISDTLPKMHTFQRAFSIQFWILLKRAFKTSIRNKQLMHLRIMSHIIVGVLIGTIYYGVGANEKFTINNLGCIFFTMLFIVFTGLMPTILTCT